MLQCAWHLLFLLDKRVGFICLNCRDLKRIWIWLLDGLNGSRTNMEVKLGCPRAKFICMIHYDIIWILMIENIEQRVWGQKIENINLAQNNRYTRVGMSIIYKQWLGHRSTYMCVSLFIHCSGLDFVDDGITDFREFLTMKSQEESRLFEVKCMLTYQSWLKELKYQVCYFESHIKVKYLVHFLWNWP